MNIQVGHSSAMNFTEDLYTPLKNSDYFTSHEWIFPHEDDNRVSAWETIKQVDLFIADVSLPSTWLWIELWICMDLWINILCIAKEWASVSNTIRKVVPEITRYADKDQLLDQIWARLK